MPAFKSHTTGTADVAWDAGAQEKKVRSGETRSYYAKVYAWYDPNLDEGNKSTYKFIHHAIASNGDPGDAVTKACTSGIGVLNGGMGGTNIPKADHQGVYDHLAKHLRDAGREPPPLNGSADTAALDEPTTDTPEPSNTEGKQRGQAADHAIGLMTRQEIMRQASLEPWAILPSALQALLSRSGLLHAQDNQAIEIEALSRPGPKSGRVARIPIAGAITRRDSLWSLLFGGTSIDGLTKALRSVAADESISTVLLDIDSPGGTVSGLPELAGEVRRLRQSKHVVALANSMAASAAYWIASQADEVVATPEALVGSVGVFAVHEDWSKFYEQHGVKLSYIAAGKYKVEGNETEPLTEDARTHLQSIVDDAYNLFVGDVAKGRGIQPKDVKADYGEGRVLSANAAKAAGLIDRIAGADETLRRLSGARAESPGGNSLAAKRRRLEIAEKTFLEE